MACIVRGTTPILEITFQTVDPADLAVANLIIKQLGKIIIKKPISEATIGAKAISWTLTQAESLRLSKKENAVSVCDWKLKSGTRGRSAVKTYEVEDPGEDKEI